ncbi:MAG: uroporphyrinogen decarboxylase family protein [Clostridia bacterium]|nr:uroporphyrinogen decarboxylase family protein [Clostridia bacterium]
MKPFENMREWLERWGSAPQRKAFPILSFPAASLLGVSVQELISSAEMQAAGIAAVARRCDSLAAVSFMDLSVEAEAFGAEIRMAEDEVPTVVGHILSDAADAQTLAVPPIGSGRTGICIDAVRRAAELVQDRPVFAGMIGPYSLAARLYGVTECMMACFDDPDAVHLVLRKVTDFLKSYALAFKACGVHGVMMAEPVAGMLSPDMEEEFSAPYVREIVEAVQDDGFLLIYHNCGDNTPEMLPSILSTGAAAYHFGNSVDLAEMLADIPENVAVMGNIDPVGEFRHGSPESMGQAVRKLLDACGGRRNFILSSGCDIPPACPWENIDAFFAAAKEYYEK